jgi:excisionase family DNA binding protein
MEVTAPADHALMLVSEVSKALRLSPATVKRMCGSGDLPAIRARRTWRISRLFVDQLLTQVSAGKSVVVEEYAASWRPEEGALTCRS